MNLTEEKIKAMAAAEMAAEMAAAIAADEIKLPKPSVSEFSNFYKQQADLTKSKNKVTEALNEAMSAQAKFYKMSTLGKIVMSNPMDPTEWTATSRYEKVNTMSNDIGLGRELKKDRPRDAVHIACIPVTLGEWMQPGVPVIVRKGEAFAAQNHTEKPIGVIDPFLPGGCPKGARVWLMLNPGSITSLRHDWTHPAFKEAPKPVPAVAKTAVQAMPSLTMPSTTEVAKARNELRSMGKMISKSLGQMIQIGYDADSGVSTYVGDDDASEFMNNHKDVFWTNWSIVTGDVPSSTDHYFSCAC